ncbi:MAG: hypothetical protein MJ063_07220 [Lachnospiraceae bacterium]|nr:hypothetical protein [Lachnospiraceae bacterium]
MKEHLGKTAYFHLPGLFEFTELYRKFLPLFYGHREWFYEDCEIASLYGAPADALWGGGRVGFGGDDAESVLSLLSEYGISGRLTFSNSLLLPERLSDRKCNKLCELFAEAAGGGSTAPEYTFPAKETAGSRAGQSVKNGVIVHSELLLSYLRETYPTLYLVSSTTKVLTEFADLKKELDREEFNYVVPDFRLNKAFSLLEGLSQKEKDKAEFLVNECCDINCKERKACYENVSLKSLGEPCADHICRSPYAAEGYRFSRAMENPAFISREDIQNIYLPMGFSNFKIEGRGLGSAVVLEFLLYYLTRPQWQLKVREEIYLDSCLDLF